MYLASIVHRMVKLNSADARAMASSSSSSLPHVGAGTLLFGASTLATIAMLIEPTTVTDSSKTVLDGNSSSTV